MAGEQVFDFGQEETTEPSSVDLRRDGRIDRLESFQLRAKRRSNLLVEFSVVGHGELTAGIRYSARGCMVPVDESVGQAPARDRCCPGVSMHRGCDLRWSVHVGRARHQSGLSVDDDELPCPVGPPSGFFLKCAASRMMSRTRLLIPSQFPLKGVVFPFETRTLRK